MRREEKKAFEEKREVEVKKYMFFFFMFVKWQKGSIHFMFRQRS